MHTGLFHLSELARSMLRLVKTVRCSLGTSATPNPHVRLHLLWDERTPFPLMLSSVLPRIFSGVAFGQSFSSPSVEGSKWLAGPPAGSCFQLLQGPLAWR